MRGDILLPVLFQTSSCPPSGRLPRRHGTCCHEDLSDDVRVSSSMRPPDDPPPALIVGGYTCAETLLSLLSLSGGESRLEEPETSSKTRRRRISGYLEEVKHNFGLAGVVQEPRNIPERHSFSRTHPDTIRQLNFNVNFFWLVPCAVKRLLNTP